MNELERLFSFLPRPDQFGTSNVEIGHALRASLERFVSEVREAEIGTFKNSVELATLVTKDDWPDGLYGANFQLAIKHSIAGNQELAGQFYRTWAQGLIADSKRRKAASLGGVATQQKAKRRRDLVLQLWRQLAKDRPRLKKSEITREVTMRLNANDRLPKVKEGTVRDWAKKIPHKAKRD